jgi:hypothetical protein
LGVRIRGLVPCLPVAPGERQEPEPEPSEP